jgi:hypothetical protein
MHLKSTLLELAKKIIKYDKKLEIYNNGEDNAYPERMERYKNNSVTASMASSKFTQYLIGKGFGEADNVIIGGRKLIDIATEIAENITDNKGVFIQVDYNLLYEPSSFKVIPFGQCRVGEKDSSEYSGKILICKDWNDDEIKKKKITSVNVFNSNKEVVKYQIDKAKGIDKYLGQVLFINLDKKYYYPLSRIDSVYMECDNEHQASVYKNTILRKGWFGNTLVVTRPLVDDSFINSNLETLDPIIRREIQEMESEREVFKENLQKFIGAGGAGGVFHVEIDFKGEKLEDAILFKDIKNNIDPSMFKEVEEVAIDKILMAYNNLPVSLIKGSEGLFSNNGDALNVAKLSFQENTSIERSKLETIVNDLMRILSDYSYKKYLSISPLIEIKNDNDPVSE